MTVNGTPATTTFVSSTQLTATVPASAIAAGGTATIGVTTNGAAAASNTQTLTISTQPTVTTGSTTLTNGSSDVVLNGTVNANTDNASASFNYGTSNTYGSSVAASPNPVTGNSPTAVTATLSNLSPNLTYHFQVVATNGGGTTTGSDVTFVSPAATTMAPSISNATASTLDVTINDPSNPANTEYAILETTTNRYVQSNGTLNTAPVWQVAGGNPDQWGGNSGIPSTARVSGLVSNTSYTFVVIARNSSGITTAQSPSGSGSTIAGNSIGITGGVPTSVCNASNTVFDVEFSSSSFSGTFKVQLSDASGVFPNNTTDGIIGSGNGSPITATIPAAQAAGTGYRVRVLNDNPEFYGSDNGANITVTQAVTPSVSIASSTGSNASCNGASVTFTATPVNGGTPSYAWTKNGNPVGTNSDTYTDAGLVSGDVIAVTLTSSISCVTTTTATADITMTVNTTAAPAAPVAAANPACASTTLDAMTDPAMDVQNYWQGTVANGTDMMAPATAPYTVNATGTYYVRAYNSSTGCWSDASSVLVTIVAAPSVTAHPGNATVYAGNGTTFSATATGTTGVQWQVNSGSGFADISNGSTYSGATSNTLIVNNITAAMSGYQFRAQYTGNAPCGVTASNAATLTVLPALATIFSESMGTPGSNTNVNTYANGTAPATFQNKGVLTFTTSDGVTDVRNSNNSSGYSGATGGGNVFFGIATSLNRNFTISGINTLNYTNLTLSFGLRMDQSGTPFVVEVSEDGTNWTALTITQPAAAGTWYAITASGTIPATANLRIRFSKNNNGQFRLDDVKLQGYRPDPTLTNITPTSATAGTSSVSLTVNGTNFVTGASAVTWNGSSAGITTTFVSATQLTATLPASLLTTPGTYTVGVTVNGALNASNTATFTVTDAPPTVVTGAANQTDGSNVTTLLGLVNPNNVSTNASFEWGLDNTYGNSAAALQNPLTGNSSQPVSVTVSGLDPNVTYHYRATATSSAGTTNGNDATFVSPAATPGAPTAGTITPSSIELTIDAAGNPAGTQFAIFETTTNKYVQANGTLGTSAVWQATGTGAGEWGSQTGVSGKLRAASLSSATSYNFQVIARNSSGTLTAAGPATSVMTSAGNTLVIDSGVPTSLCNAGNNSFDVHFTASGGFSGTFYVQLSDASGNFTNSLSSNIIGTGAASPISATVPAGYAAGTGYRVRVINDNPEFYGDDNGSDLTITAAATPSVSITAAPGSTICTGTSVTFTATPVNGGTPTYQWYKNGNPVGTNSSTYTDAALAQGDAVSVEMTSGLSCVTTATATSNTITMTVNTTAAPAAPVAAANPACGSTTLEAMTDPGGSVNYFWQGTSATGMSTASAATSAYPVNASGTYYVRAYDNVTGCWSTASSVTVTIAAAPAITTQPSGSSIFTGSNATFTAAATNSTAVQWQVNSGAGFTDIANGGNYSGATTNTFTVSGATTAMSGYQFRAVYSAAAPCGNVTTNTVILQVFPAPGTLFSENVGTAGSGDIAVGTYTGWQNQGVLAFSGVSTSTDVRTTSSSSGYTGASGSRNVFFGTSGGNSKIFEISNINTSNWSNLQLSFGLLRTSTAQNLTVEVSTDGTNYTALSFTPANNTSWNLVTASGTIPATSNLRIRFSKNNTGSFRVDDIKLVGTPATPTVTSLSPTSAVEGTSGLTLTVNGTGFVNGSTVTWNGSTTGISTSFVSGTQLTATVGASLLANAGTALVGVSSTGALASSNTETFTILPRTITLGTVSNLSFCNGASSSRDFTVAFASTGTYSGSFYVQLSDASGNFPNNTTDNIISSAYNASPITATIPAGQAPGSGYKVRVLNSNPAVYSDASAAIAIDPSAAATITYEGSPFCGGSGTAEVTRTGTATGTYSAVPAGLVIDASTGAIDLVNSTPGTYTVTYTFAGGTACASMATTQVSINPGVLVNPVPNMVACAGSATQPIVFSGAAGVTYNWTNSEPAIGLAASGTGNIGSFTATNGGTSDLVAVISVTPEGGTGCTLKPMVFRIRVRPLPTVNMVPDQALCAGSATDPITFAGAVPGTVYSWTNNNPAIGLGAIGTGDIPAFMPRNNGTSQVATITVTPRADGCSGTPMTFTITVHPAAGTISYDGAPYCPRGAAYPTQQGTPGGTYAAPAGLVINSATGEVNLALSTAGTYTVTYTIGGAVCANTATTQLTILPPATMDAPSNPVYCNGATAPAQLFTGAVGYTWTNDNPSIGLAASGSGSLPSFVAVNNTAAPVYAFINVTPQGNGTTTCSGKPVRFRITVNPTPTVTNPGTQVYCRGIVTAPVTLTGNMGTEATYNWSSSSMATGLLQRRGTNVVPAYTTVNATAGTVSTTITVRPVANKCVGAPITFTYQVGNCVAQNGGGTGEGGPDAARTATFAATVSAAPNPARDVVTVQVHHAPAKEATYSLQVINAYGSPVGRPQTFSGTTCTVSLSGLTPGNYVLQVTDMRSGLSTRKQVIKL
ncbi:hypothetical protein GCM10023184_23640 [Flaviaesturariibacter amylovorans]|uniref:T9SS type A sorting domain-containing protein n=1 Tax=Flaviaesturariibacter amylovorans TaxID=1084520 RepID=A0ABP8GY27_9BACT